MSVSQSVSQSLTRCRNRLTADGGFTLIEVLAVMVIAGILGATATPVISGYRERAAVTATNEFTRQVINGIVAADVVFHGNDLDGGMMYLDGPGNILDPNYLASIGIPEAPDDMRVLSVWPSLFNQDSPSIAVLNTKDDFVIFREMSSTHDVSDPEIRDAMDELGLEALSSTTFILENYSTSPFFIG